MQDQAETFDGGVRKINEAAIRRLKEINIAKYGAFCGSCKLGLLCEDHPYERQGNMHFS